MWSRIAIRPVDPLSFDKAVELEPNEATWYDNRGLYRVPQGDHAGAIVDHDHAIRLAPAASAPDYTAQSLEALGAPRRTTSRGTTGRRGLGRMGRLGRERRRVSDEIVLGRSTWRAATLTRRGLRTGELLG